MTSSRAGGNGGKPREQRWSTSTAPSLAKKFYNLCEFPYPSAEGLHVGHVFKYSGVDAYGRFQRMRGRAVFQPMGWDAFGINAENYALRVGVHPAISSVGPRRDSARS